MCCYRVTRIITGRMSGWARPSGCELRAEARVSESPTSESRAEVWGVAAPAAMASCRPRTVPQRLARDGARFACGRLARTRTRRRRRGPGRWRGPSPRLERNISSAGPSALQPHEPVDARSFIQKPETMPAAAPAAGLALTSLAVLRQPFALNLGASSWRD